MEKTIKKLKIIFLVTGLLTILTIVFDLLLHISIKDQSGLYLVTTAFFSFVFLATLYIYFIMSDININEFKYLKILNIIATLIGLSTFLYFGFIEQHALYLLYPAYTIIFIIVNNIVMSFIFWFKKTGFKYIFNQWILLILSIIIYFFTHKLLIFVGLFTV
ncbi:hypothetical protein ACM55M_02405 [Flavobacterium sp. ZT3R25]|uniref:hypothetical protein n=1 Tax=Flavobacterium galactosi TaxID=3398735 RepID=UPI003A85E76D